MQRVGEIFISAEVMRDLGIPSVSTVSVRIGHRFATADLNILNYRAAAKYMLSPSLSAYLEIHKKKRLLIRYDRQAHQIHLGPTIGIFSKSLPVQAGETPTSIYSELIYLARLVSEMPGYIFIFTASTVNWDNQTVKGYTFSGGKNRWSSDIYPLPDIVYDRITSRSSENQPLIQEAKAKLLQLPYLKYFNHSFLDKWSVHQMLLTNGDLHTFLPETLPLSFENMEYMLSKYQNLYVKPSNGSLGRGIIRVRQDNRELINYSIKNRRNINTQVDNAERFLKKTQRYRGSNPYIIQQGLDLIKYQNASFDLRIIYQKNGQGQWQIGKRFVRIAPKGSTISNLSSGGRVELSRKVFKRIFKDAEQIKEINRQIDQICFLAANTLEKENKSIFGELGLDIGISPNGHPWLIEINSKPRKTTESEYSQTIMKKTFKRPLEYATYLAGFTEQ